MKSLASLIVFLFASSIVFGQDSISVERRFVENLPFTAIDSFYHQFPNFIFISFEDGFNDSVQVTVNDVPITKTYLKTNESLGYAGGFGISFSDSSEIKNLKLTFVNRGKYIKEQLNLKYRHLRIIGHNTWLLLYSNKFPMRE